MVAVELSEQLEDALAELERLREERDRLDDACFELRQRAEAAEAKLAEAQQRAANDAERVDFLLMEVNQWEQRETWWRELISRALPNMVMSATRWDELRSLLGLSAACRPAENDSEKAR